MLNEENIDFILANSSYSEIQKKRIRKGSEYLIWNKKLLNFNIFLKELHQISEIHDPTLKFSLLSSQPNIIIKVKNYCFSNIIILKRLKS